jgi:uncharacterized protein YndB with AHSA1/START domain
MTPTVKIAPVIKTVRVKASKKHAFETFTAGMSRWWPPAHSISKTKSPLKEAIIEPRVGGRGYEKGEDGSECDWGTVLVWDPPEKLVLAWQINGQWQFDPDLVTEVEVWFSSESGGITRVDLEHRNLDRFGDAAEAIRKSFDSPGGWPGLLDSFAKAAN